MRRLTLLFALLLAFGLPASAGAAAFPDRIDLPDGFAPEGIAIGRGTTFYTGSLSLQGIWRGDLRTGDGAFLVDGGGPFVGMKVDAANRLWVAGGFAGLGYVFDAGTGEPIGEPLALATAPTFINDVVVTPDAVYFTDSMRPAIYRVPIGVDGSIGAPITIEFEESAIGFQEGAFNLNGIDATPDGGTLITVNSTAGALFLIDAASGAVTPVELEGGPVTAGDGILLEGRTLYVVRNELNLVAVVRLSPDLANGVVVDELTGDTDVPTTIARFGASLYVVNAAFRPPEAPPATEFWVTRIAGPGS